MKRGNRVSFHGRGTSRTCVRISRIDTNLFFEIMKTVTSSKVIVISAVFLMAFGNAAFFSNVSEVYPPNLKNIAFLCSLSIGFSCAIVLLLSLFCYRHTTKPLLIAVFLISSFAAYFMDTYNIIIDDTMIQNIVSTDPAEISDLITVKLIVYVLFLGLMPSAWIYKVRIVYADTRREALSRIKLFSATLGLALAVILVFGRFYASFFREHKPLRYFSNPSYYIYSTVKYLKRSIKKERLPLKPVGLDAKTPATDTHRELIIFVVGETARADRFSLNGYKRETNPLLEKEAVISFSNFWACGTSTALSVPCMFSIYTQSKYSDTKAQTTENVLDVLKHAGVNVLWLDNNSDSKGVAVRVRHENYKTPDKNPVCEVECLDEGMLAHLQTYVDDHPKGDIFIVLHQMGSHGPAYYKRYPDAFEKFKPVCKTKQLEDCSQAEIDNAYDNTILYTDYFLSKVIDWLRRNDAQFESALFYVSDHGESLGEHGVYLHGLPDFIAPDVQKQVPAIMWFGSTFDEIDMPSLIKKRHEKYSHDYIFHTILGFMEIETSVYDKALDIVHGAQ